MAKSTPKLKPQSKRLNENRELGEMETGVLNGTLFGAGNVKVNRYQTTTFKNKKELNIKLDITIKADSSFPQELIAHPEKLPKGEIYIAHSEKTVIDIEQKIINVDYTVSGEVVYLSINNLNGLGVKVQHGS